MLKAAVEEERKAQETKRFVEEKENTEEETKMDKRKEVKRRTALLHIPIEKDEIAGRPFLVGDVEGSLHQQCFGPQVKTCGHIAIAYAGELGKLRWKNVKPAFLELKRGREEWSSDEDFEPEKKKTRR